MKSTTEDILVERSELRELIAISNQEILLQYILRVAIFDLMLSDTFIFDKAIESVHLRGITRIR